MLDNSPCHPWYATKKNNLDKNYCFDILWSPSLCLRDEIYKTTCECSNPPAYKFENSQSGIIFCPPNKARVKITLSFPLLFSYSEQKKEEIWMKIWILMFCIGWILNFNVRSLKRRDIWLGRDIEIISIISMGRERKSVRWLTNHKKTVSPFAFNTSVDRSVLQGLFNMHYTWRAKDFGPLVKAFLCRKMSENHAKVAENKVQGGQKYKHFLGEDP